MLWGRQWGNIAFFNTFPGTGTFLCTLLKRREASISAVEMLETRGCSSSILAHQLVCNTMSYAQERELWSSQQSPNKSNVSPQPTVSRARRIPNLGVKNLCIKDQNLPLKTAYQYKGFSLLKKNRYNSENVRFSLYTKMIIRFSQVWGSFKKWPDMNCNEPVKI